MQALADGNGFGDAQIDFEEARGGERIAPEIAVAAGRRSDAGNREGGASVGEASASHAEGDAGNEGRSSATTDGGTRLRSAEIEPSVFAGDDVVGSAGSQLDDGSEGEAAEETLCETITTFALRALEDGAGDPAMALVVYGVGTLEEGETGVLWLERRLQIGGIVDGMRIGVAGEELERMREALGEIEGQGIVGGAAVGELGIDAVKGDGYAKSLGVTGESRQTNLRCVSDGEGLSRRDKTSEGRIGPRGTEEVEEGRGTDELTVERGKRSRATVQYTQDLRSDQVQTAISCSGSDVAGGDGDGNGIRDGDARSAGVKGILSKELGIGGVDVNGAMQVQAASVLIAEAEFPGAGDFAFDGKIGLLGVTVFEIGGNGQGERKNG